MTGNWIETLQSALSGPAEEKLGSWAGLGTDATRQVVDAAVPMSIASLAENVTTPDAARGLLDGFRQSGVDQLGVDDLARLGDDPSELDRVARKGEGLIGKIFRGDLGSIAGGLAGHLGVGKGGIMRLLPLLVSIVMGYLGKTVLGRGMDAGGLLGFLKDQGRAASSLVPGPLAGLAGLAGLGGLGAARAEARVPSPRPIEEPEEHQRAGLGWVPWALAGLAAVALFAWLLNRRKPEVAVPGSRASSADVQKVSGRQSPLKFSEYLSGRSDAPWIVQGLEFETGADRIVATSRGVLDDVALGLGGDSAAKIKIVGHTDATGSPDANRELSRRRADAAKAYLVEKGVSAERIDTAGMGADQPIASNDSEEGRARNRRTEIYVVR